MAIPIKGQPSGTPELAYNKALARGAKNPAFTLAYLIALYDDAAELGINPDVLVSQWDLETDSGRSEYWLRDGNPAGLAAFDDGSNWGLSFTSELAARAHVTHMARYLGLDAPASWVETDARWQAIEDAGYVGSVVTTDDLGNGKWATDPQYAQKLQSRYSAYWGEPEQEKPVAKNKLFVVLVAGHNSVGDGGNPVERALTPSLAKAYSAAFTKAGIPNKWVNPTLYPGGLDGLASATAKAIRDADADLVLSLDLHFNGPRSGVHAIPPHNKSGSGGMLNTAIVAGRVAADVMENNTLDVRLAEAYAKAIVAAVDGMTLYGSNGIMPENQTGVGLPLSQGGKNSRLAMAAYSAPYRDKAVRLTIEHGGTNDASKPDFANKCAAAIVAATKVVLADRIESGTPEPPVEPPPTGDPGNPSLASFLFGESNGYSFDPNGPVSKLWFETGNDGQAWPRLIDVRVDGGTKFFVFGDGSVIVSDGGVVAYLGELDTE